MKTLLLILAVMCLFAGASVAAPPDSITTYTCPDGQTFNPYTQTCTTPINCLPPSYYDPIFNLCMPPPPSVFVPTSCSQCPWYDFICQINCIVKNEKRNPIRFRDDERNLPREALYIQQPLTGGSSCSGL